MTTGRKNSRSNDSILGSRVFGSYSNVLAAIPPQDQEKAPEALDLATTQPPPATAHHSMSPRVRDIKALTVDEALRAAREIRPHVYKITNYHSEDFNLLVMGCTGEDRPEQKLVAIRMNEAAKRKKYIGTGLGDYFYDDGASHPRDPCFQKLFYDVYSDPNLPHLRSVPFWLGIGNHGRAEYKENVIMNSVAAYTSWVPGASYLANYMPYKRVQKAFKPTVTGDAREINKRAHSFLHHPGDPLIPDKVDFYNAKEVDFTQSPKYNMPTPFFSFYSEEHKVQVFILNSNYYAKHFYKKTQREPVDQDIPVNQAEWFEQEYKRAVNAGYKVVVGWHHPSKDFGKRTKHGDAHLFLKPHELKELNKRYGFPPDANFYSPLLEKIFEEQGIEPDVIYGAHAHCMQVYKNKNSKTMHIISGGGGGETQPRCSHKERENVGCFAKQNGYSTLSYNPGTGAFEFTIETIDSPIQGIKGVVKGCSLKFTHHDSQPLREEETDPNVTALREVVKKTCYEFQDFLANPENYTGELFDKRYPHGDYYDIDFADYIINYFNQYTPDDYKTTVAVLHDYMQQIPYKTQTNSLFAAINRGLERIFHKKIEDLFVDSFAYSLRPQ